MKSILSVLTLVILFAFEANASMDSQCLESAKSWIYSNTSAGSSEAATKAVSFCARGGDVTCLAPAKSWIYSNTSRGNSDSAVAAISFCSGGEVSCLSTTKDWIYRNTSANASQAAEQAISACGERRSCRR